MYFAISSCKQQQIYIKMGAAGDVLGCMTRTRRDTCASCGESTVNSRFRWICSRCVTSSCSSLKAYTAITPRCNSVRACFPLLYIVCCIFCTNSCRRLCIVPRPRNSLLKARKGHVLMMLPSVTRVRRIREHHQHNWRALVCFGRKTHTHTETASCRPS